MKNTYAFSFTLGIPVQIKVIEVSLPPSELTSLAHKQITWEEREVSQSDSDFCVVLCHYCSWKAAGKSTFTAPQEFLHVK